MIHNNQNIIYEKQVFIRILTTRGRSSWQQVRSSVGRAQGRAACASSILSGMTQDSRLRATAAISMPRNLRPQNSQCRTHRLQRHSLMWADGQMTTRVGDVEPERERPHQSRSSAPTAGVRACASPPRAGGGPRTPHRSSTSTSSDRVHKHRCQGSTKGRVHAVLSFKSPYNGHFPCRCVESERHQISR